ncbi:MAG TPA: hypothetical protein PLK30_06555 [Blastocatellia bacterium]|nr:hypothetical protein [Blastocatellia bacterium]
MIPELRKKFNASFTPEKYQRLLQLLDQAVGTKIEFRPCETPVFLPKDLLIEMELAGKELIAQLCRPDYLAASSRAVPAEFNAPNEGAHPHFIQVDFALTHDADGRLSPKLIELQGCASLYAFQHLLPHEYRRVYDLGKLDYLLGGLTDESYLELLRQVLLNGHKPEHVVLMEIDPLHQKTLPDFMATEKLFGIPFIDVSDIIKRGNKLFYPSNGREVEIRRIYNRVIIDEFVRRKIKTRFDFRDELDVEWTGHPNWYFRMSKFSLPFLNHPTVPRAWFLNQLDSVPDDLENFVLKPLFSFAGSGVKVNITTEDLEAVPVDERGDFLLQEKVAYAPVIETPDEPSKVEVRVMFIWPDAAAEPIAATTLTRLSKGVMMGVDFNKNKSWVGSSCSFFEA